MTTWCWAISCLPNDKKGNGPGDKGLGGGGERDGGEGVCPCRWVIRLPHPAKVAKMAAENLMAKSQEIIYPRLKFKKFKW